MTENPSTNEFQVQNKKPFKKEKMANRKRNLQRKMEEEMIQGVWNGLLYVGIPLFLGFMAFAISISLGSFIAGFSGIMSVIKKDSTFGRGGIRGTWAVVLGVLITILFWSIAAYFFWVELSINWWGF